MEDTIDLFELPETHSKELAAVIEKYSQLEGSYKNCENLVKELEAIGYTCDYGLDAVPFDLKKIS